ncbi:phosphatase PAP2 family protein [Lacrimispora sp. NSJ-141]|uniref:Phosphatase PAP2 family protein n=1 Tax=Lientehia hominis TaxID=2897778 RepID=A0AAP2RII2_9FIRM|nr:phosphatase PAP2 family protein [Lientehia hominis]
MKAIKNFFSNYRQSWVLLYVFIYFPWFFWLEKHVTVGTQFTNIHIAFDDLIPFNEYFIIPYLFWFIFVAGSVTYFLLKRPKKEFYRMTAFLFIGMTVCLAICTLFPNGQTMRPPVNPEKNLFSKLIVMLYKTDTSTNVFPSIHVFASLGINLAWWNSPVSQKHKWIRPVTTLITISICLSTVFLKQHSVLDGLGAIVLAIVLYFFVYQPEMTRASARAAKEKTKSKKLYSYKNKL